MNETASPTTNPARRRRLSVPQRAASFLLLLVVALTAGVVAAGQASALAGPSYDQPTLTCNVMDRTILLRTSMERISPSGYEVEQAQTWLWSKERGRWVDETTQIVSFRPGQNNIGYWGDYNSVYLGQPAGHYQARTVYTWWWRASTTQPWSSTSVTVDAAYITSSFPGGYLTDDCNTFGSQIVIPIG